MKTIYTALVLTAVLLAQCLAQGYQGTGNNFGSGWRSDGNGGFTGTGNNFGSGWRSSGSGYTGTGNNFGSGWNR